MAMSEYVIQNPVPTPEQMAKMLGVSQERVARLRGIMKAPSTGSFVQRKGAAGLTAIKSTSVRHTAIVVGKGKDATRAKTKTR